MVNRSSLEKEFELILIKFPYLIDQSLLNGEIKNQHKIKFSNGKIFYIDLIYFK